METSKDNDLKARIDKWINHTIKKKQEEHKQDLRYIANFHYPDLDKESFAKLLVSMGTLAIQRRGQRQRFVIDDNNREVIRQMWLWVIASPECKWDLRKGIYLGGKIGCGKTILMDAFCEVLTAISGRIFTKVSAKDLYPYLQKYGRKSLATCPLYVDELGRESVEVTDFGNRIRPFVDVIEQRYETGAITMITSNFLITTLSKETDENGNDQKGYGDYICERVQEMTNMVVLPGGSRRQMWNSNGMEAPRP